jgi:hypothetical protein
MAGRRPHATISPRLEVPAPIIRRGYPPVRDATEGLGLFHLWVLIVGQPEELGGGCRGGLIGNTGVDALFSPGHPVLGSELHLAGAQFFLHRLKVPVTVGVEGLDIARRQ